MDFLFRHKIISIFGGACFYAFFLIGRSNSPVIDKICHDVRNNNVTVIDLKDYYDFEWDEAFLYYYPYLFGSDIRRELSKMKYRIKGYDEIGYKSGRGGAPLLFVKDGKIVYYEINMKFPKLGHDKFEKALNIDDDLRRKNLYFIRFDNKQCKFRVKKYGYRSVKLSKYDG